MRSHFRLTNLPFMMATLMLSACHNNQQVLQEVLPNTTTNIETKHGLEVQIKAPDGTLLEKHFPLVDGRGHNFYDAESGALTKSCDEYLNAKPRSDASWTADGKRVRVGTVFAENGDRLLNHELLDSGATKTSFRLDENVRAEAQRASDTVVHWIWYQGVGPAALKWFEETHTGRAESLKLVSLEFFRPSLRSDSQVVRECSVTELPTEESRTVNAADVTFYREDGVTADFRQRWSQDIYMEEGTGVWKLDKVDELDETGSTIVRSFEIRDSGSSDSLEIISVTDWPDTDRAEQRRYGSVYGAKFQALVETWREDGVEHSRFVQCASRTSGRIDEDALAANNADSQPEPDIAPAHFVRFRGDLRNGVVSRLQQALNKARSQDEVASLRWYDVKFP